MDSADVERVLRQAGAACEECGKGTAKLGNLEFEQRLPDYGRFVEQTVKRDTALLASRPENIAMTARMKARRPPRM